MKKKFSTKWKGSSQPRKQRKYMANSPLHLKKKIVAANLAKDLRKKYKTRSLAVRKGDTVKIMRGKFKGKKGKIALVKLKTQKIEVEGIQIKKMDTSKANVPLKPSNVQIVELNMGDRKRGKNLKKSEKREVKEEKKLDEKPEGKSKENDGGKK